MFLLTLPKRTIFTFLGEILLGAELTVPSPR